MFVPFCVGRDARRTPECETGDKVLKKLGKLGKQALCKPAHHHSASCHQTSVTVGGEEAASLEKVGGAVRKLNYEKPGLTEDTVGMQLCTWHVATPKSI
eukprot:6464704-Amphidinium_carterae.1